MAFLRHSIDLTARFGRAAVSWAIWCLGCLVWGVLVLPPVLLLGPRWPNVRRLARDITHVAHVFYVWLIPVLTLRVQHESLKRGTTRVLVVNHQSILDPLLMLSIERRLGGPARIGLYRVPVLRTVLEAVGFYRADGFHAAAHRFSSAVAEAEQLGGSILFFPEGTRTRDGEIGPFYNGAFRLAVEHDLPIQPIVLDGLHRLLPPGAFLSRSSKRAIVTIRYLELLEPPYGDGSEREVARRLSDRVRGDLIEELFALRQDPR